eukprot:13610977-Ditylum_brightwellii.AAC.1
MLFLFRGGEEERERKEERMRREVNKWRCWTLERQRTFSAEDGGCWALLVETTRADQQHSQ